MWECKEQAANRVWQHLSEISLFISCSSICSIFKNLSDFGGLSGSLAALEVGEVAGEAFDASMTMTVYKEIF